MKNLFQAKRQSSRVDLSSLVARVTKDGLEAGWTGLEEQYPLVSNLIRSELRMLEEDQNGALGPDPSTLAHQRQHLEERKLSLDALSAAHRQRSAAAESNRRAAASWAWDSRRAVTLAAALALGGVTALAAGGKLTWQAWLALFLAGVLLQLRPWGLAAGFRASAVRLAADLGYVYRTWRSSRFERRMLKLEQRIEHEALRRQQAERWISERLEWILSQFLLAKGRGDRARLIAAQSEA